MRAMRSVRQGCFNCVAEIELAVAVRIRTAILEKRARRRIEQMRLRGWYACGRPLETQLDAKVLDSRERSAQHLRRGAIATQLIHSPLARGGGRSELHKPYPTSEWQ